MTARFAALSFAISIALLGARPALAEPLVTPIAEVKDSDEVKREGDRIRHLGAGYLFPASLGEMPARKLIVYGPGDISMQYTLHGGGRGDAWIDLYVYPANDSLEAEATGVEASIVEHFAATPAPAPDGIPRAARPVRSGWFNGTVRGTPLVTGYYLTHHGPWVIKLRTSLPAALPRDVVERAAGAINAALPDFVASDIAR